eukprot:489311-Prymnesium_polylepis.1
MLIHEKAGADEELRCSSTSLRFNATATPRHRRLIHRQHGCRVRPGRVDAAERRTRDGRQNEQLEHPSLNVKKLETWFKCSGKGSGCVLPNWSFFSPACTSARSHVARALQSATPPRTSRSGRPWTEALHGIGLGLKGAELLQATP